MSAEDLINRVKQRRLNKPTYDLPPPPTDPIIPTTPSTTIPPATPTFSIAPYMPDAVPQQDRGGGGNRSFLSNVFAIPGGVWNSIFDVAGAVPGLVKAGYYTAGGITSGFSPKEIQKIATRVNEAQDQGLKGFDIAKYAAEEKYPLVTQTVDAAQKLGGNVSELASLGYVDVGEPGINYANAFNKGQLSQTAMADAGTLILLGRLSGLGNVGITAGGAISEAGAPRLGSVISSASRFVEEPIGSSVRGAARIANLGLEQTGRFSGLTDATGRIASAEAPLRQAATEAVGARRSYFETRLTDLTAEETRLNKQLESLAPDDPMRITLDEQISKIKKQRENALSGTGRPKLMNRAIKAQQRVAQAIRNGWVGKATRWGNAGSVPEPVRILDENAKAARVRQQEATASGDTAAAQYYEDQATFYEDASKLKQTDTEGRLNPKNWDDVEKQTVWSSAVLIMTKVKEEIARAYDSKISEGLTHEQAIDWVTKNITPPELLPEIAAQGYAWTPQAIDRVVRFSKGQLDAFDSMNIEGAARLINEFSTWFNRQAEAGIGRVTGAIPFTYKYNLPDPMNMLRELASRPKLKELIINVLDETMATILARDYMDIVTEQKIDLENPTGLFEKYATQNFGSEQYAIAYQALTEAFDVLTADPQFATFMRNKMIYPASMRPVLGAREQFAQAARAEDVTFMADEMARLAVENADLIPGRTLKSIATAIKLALGEQTKYDVRTWNRVRATVNRLIADTQKAQAEYAGAGAKLSGRIDTSLARLQQIEQFAVAAGALIDQVIANPEIAFPDITAGSPRLLATQQAEQANLSRIQAIPDELAQVDAEIKASIEQQRQDLAYKQQEADNLAAKLDQAKQKASDANDAETAAHQQHDQLQAYIDDFNRLTDEELALLQSDFQEGIDIHDRYTTGKNSASKGQAQAAKRIAVEEASQRATTARGLVDSLMPSRLRRSRTMTIGLETDPNAMSFMQEDFRQPFESAVYQAIGDAKLAKKAYNDFVNTRTVMDEGVAVDQLHLETGRDFGSDSQFMQELGRAWAEQWLAEKDLGRAKQRGIESYRKELADASQASIDQAINAATEGRATSLPWIEKMIEFTDRNALNEATREVQRLRRELKGAKSAAETAQTELNRISEQARKASSEAQPSVPSELLKRRIELEKEKVTTQKAVRRLAGAAERAQAAEPKTQAALIKREQIARLRGVGRLNADGTAEMLPGRAGKLDAEHQTILAKQAELDTKLADVRRKAAEQDALEQQTQTIQNDAQAVQNLEGQPMGPQLLAQSRTSRLNVEGSSPVWYPAGETASVTPQARIATQLRSEAAGAERPTTTEGLKTTNVMPMTSGKFGDRINEILGQWERNVVIQNLILNREFVTDVATHFTPEELTQFDMAARRKISQQRTNLNSYQFEQLVKEEIGNTILAKLEEKGLEPVSKVKMPDPEDIYTGRGSLDSFKDIVEGKDIDGTTLVMRKGMRDRVASSFVARGDTAIPASVRRVIDFVGDKTSRWKSVILPISVRWQVGDYMGNIINAWVRGDIDPVTMMQMMKVVDQLIREDTGVGKLKARTGGMTNRTFNNPVLEALIEAGIQGRSLRLEDIRDILAGNNRALPIGEVNPSFGRDFRTKAFNFNEYINTQQKLSVAMVKLQEILDKQGRSMADIDPVTLHNDPQLHAAVTESVQFANETLGAFSELSPWERNFLRQVFPFWSWIKFINMAAGKLLLDSPDRVLFYTHLGSMSMDPDSKDLFNWLQGQTPIGGYLFDLSFTNPYTDAIMFQRNPFEAGAEQATSLSPVLTFGLSAMGELVYGATGRKLPVITTVSRPGYLEGRPEASTRTLGDTLGGIGYLGLKSLGGPFRNLLDVGPSKTNIPFTDVSIGPGPKFQQGSARTSGRYAVPRLPSNVARLSSLLRTFGIPAPTISVEEAKRQAEEQALADEQSLLRRQQERDRANAG